MSIKNLKKNKLITLTSAIVFLCLFFGCMIYLKFYGFNSALKELVHSKTHGEYSLIIGHSSVNALSMTLTLDSIKLVRNSNAPIKGIRSVNISHIKIHLASISSLFIKDQFDITHFTIDEPIIEIDAQKKQHKDVNLTQQIVKLYPAVESLLERFNIEYFSIKMGSIGIKKPGQSTFNLKLIDLLIEQWNIKHLTKDRQLQLQIGKQDLPLGKGNFKFTAIAYNFKKRQLRFSNFNYSSLDSVSQSKTEISGEYLQLDKLRYAELLNNQKLIYEKAIIANPIINLNLKLKNNKEKKSINENELITRLIKQAVGECAIDSIIILNAKVNAILEHEKDIIIVNLPTFNFKLHTFKVEEESSTLQIGEIDFKADRPTCTLKNGIELSCSNLHFDRTKNLIIEKVIVYNTKEKKKIVTCKSVKLKTFRLLHFLFYKELFIESISLNNAEIQLSKETFKSSAQKSDTESLKDISIGYLEVNNTSLNYTDNEKTYTVKNISLDIRNINKHKLNGYQYEIHKVDLVDALFNQKLKSLGGHFNELHFDGKNLRAGEIRLQKDSLILVLQGINAISTNSHNQIQRYTQWNSIFANKVNVSGKMPHFIENKETASKNAIPTISIKQSIINNLLVSIQNDNIKIKAAGKNISISEINTSEKEIYGKVIGNLTQVNLTTPEIELAIKEVNIHLPENISLKNIGFKKDKIEVASASMVLNSLKQTDSLWNVNTITLASIAIKKQGNKLFSADSVGISNAKIPFNTPPLIGNLEVYNPVIIIPENNIAESPKQPSISEKKSFPFNSINNFTIYPGMVYLQNNKTIEFGLIKGNLSDKRIWFSSLNTEIDKMTFQINSLNLSQNKLVIDSFFVKPNEQWYAKNNIQDTKLNTDIYGLYTTGFYLDSVLSTHDIKNIEISIDSSRIRMLRDKRLPEPPEVEKSASLSGLLQLPGNNSINSIKIVQGTIQYSEISKKTGEVGILELNDFSATAKLDYSKSHIPTIKMNATSKFYNNGLIKLYYETVDTSSFALDANISNFELTKLNSIVIPLQSLKIKSGYLNEYNLHIIANNDTAVGDADITYKDLHVMVLKNDDPERKNLSSEVLTFLADGIILQHNKTNATIKVKQPRVKYKSTFNYWVKSAIHGAVGAIRKGKEIKIPVKNTIPSVKL